MTEPFDFSGIFTAALGIFFIIFWIAALLDSIVITKERHLKFVSLLGKYQKTLTAGIGFKIPFIAKVDATVYTGRDNEKICLQLKTKDQIMFDLSVNVQYEVSSSVSEAFKAVYNIDNYRRDMHSVATDCAITVANTMEIEDLFSDKERITDQIKERLSDFLKDFGVEVHRVLSDEPKLPSSIEERNNSIIAAKRDKEAANDIADKIRIEKVGAANADGESVKIRMEKLGQAREAYAEKTALAVEKLTRVGASPEAALEFLNRIGEQDALVTASRNGSTIIFQNSPNVGGDSSARALLAMQTVGQKSSTTG